MGLKTPLALSESFGGVWVRQWGKTVILICLLMCLSGVAGDVCWDRAWGYSASSMCPVKPQMGACSSLTSHQISHKARLDWHVSQLKPLSRRSLHISCVCHWFSFTCRMIELFPLLFEEVLEPPGPSGVGLSGEISLLNHSSFTAASVGRLVFLLLGMPWVWIWVWAVSLLMQVIWRTLSLSLKTLSRPQWVIYIHKKFRGRRRILVSQWNPPVLGRYDGAWKWQCP